MNEKAKVKNMTDLAPFVAALASSNPLEASCQALRQLAYDVLDLKQFTMMTFDQEHGVAQRIFTDDADCLLYTSPSPRDQRGSRMPSSA